MSASGEVTFIIPTYNRPRHLARLLKYYAQEKCSHFFIIADSSSDENKKQNRKIVSEQKRLQIVHLDHYASDTFYVAKVANALHNVVTPYVNILADDDFILLQGMQECKKFLDKHTDFSFAQGVHYGFTFPYVGSQIKWFVLDIVYGLRTIEENFVDQRIERAIERYFSSMLALYRTSVLQSIMTRCAESTSEYLTFEYFFMALSVLAGKGKCLKIPFIVRELSDDSEGAVLNVSHADRAIIENQNRLNDQKNRLNIMLHNAFNEINSTLTQSDRDKIFISFFETFDQKFKPVEASNIEFVKAILPHVLRKCISRGIAFYRLSKNVCKHKIIHHKWSFYYESRIRINCSIKEAAITCNRSGIDYFTQV